MQVNQAAEPLYIVKPFSGGGMASLFSTHPRSRSGLLRELGGVQLKYLFRSAELAT